MRFRRRRSPSTPSSRQSSLGGRFGEVEIERWDAPLLQLPTRAAVRDYLVGKGVDRRLAEAKADAVAVPLSVTKRGALVFARKA
jgi:hypothetical protein